MLTQTKHPDRQKTGKIANGHRSVLQKPEDSIWRLSVERYHQMIAAGVLTDEDPVELLAGWLIQKMPKGPHHSGAIRRLRRSLERILGEAWIVEPQDAITLAESEPEPDIYVAQGDESIYATRHPYADDLVLVVEVADATLSRDRNLKQRVYAQAGIDQYWIVNLIDHQIEVYRQPTAKAKTPTYSQRQDYGMADSVPLLIEGEVIGTIPVAEIIMNDER